MLIFPSLVMSIRTLSTPAARAARMARVMSDCRNVAGARLIATTVKSSLLPARRALTVPGFDFLNQLRPSISTQARKHISSVGAAFNLRTGPRTFDGAAVRQEDRHCVASVFPANALRYRVATIAALPNEPSEGQAAAGLAAVPALPVHHRKAFAEDYNPPKPGAI